MSTVTPAVLYAAHTLPDGSVISLALVRTRWATEGQAILERTDSDGSIDLIERFAWFIRRTDDGPATLGLDDCSRAMRHEVTTETIDVLTAQLVGRGAAWGLEAAEAYS